MAGWESCRHSARQRLGIRLPARSVVHRIEVDTYMHCLNAFKAMYIFGADLTAAATSKDFELEALRELPRWTVQVGDADAVECDDDRVNALVDQLQTPDNDVSYSLKSGGGSGRWRCLLDYTPLKRDTLHEFTIQSGESRPVTHIVVLGIPDGGLHRIGFFGVPVHS